LLLKIREAQFSLSIFFEYPILCLEIQHSFQHNANEDVMLQSMRSLKTAMNEIPGEITISRVMCATMVPVKIVHGHNRTLLATPFTPPRVE
jgi:hypothetical protein